MSAVNAKNAKAFELFFLPWLLEQQKNIEEYICCCYVQGTKVTFTGESALKYVGLKASKYICFILFVIISI